MENMKETLKNGLDKGIEMVSQGNQDLLDSMNEPRLGQTDVSVTSTTVRNFGLLILYYSLIQLNTYPIIRPRFQ